MELMNQVAIVTGGASGIGLAIVEKFLENGAKTVIADYSDAGAAVASDLGAKFGADHVHFIKTDVSKEADVKNCVDETVSRFGTLDIMVANAGISLKGTVDVYPMEYWDKMIGICLTGVFLCDKYASIEMLKHKKGAIINMGSVMSLVGVDGGTAYSTCKGGVANLTKCIALAHSKNGIRANCVAPGFITTPLLGDFDEAKLRSLVDLHPIGRLGRPEEIANAVVFLASEKASFITGAILPVDGGYTAQ